MAATCSEVDHTPKWTMFRSGACSEVDHVPKWSMLRSGPCSEVEHATKWTIRGVGSAPRPGGAHNFTPTCKRLGIYYLAGVLCRGSLKGSGGTPTTLSYGPVEHARHKKIWDFELFHQRTDNLVDMYPQIENPESSY